jgi:predicted oxidoreductase (fatty acid repression mutant protein)
METAAVAAIATNGSIASAVGAALLTAGVKAGLEHFNDSGYE